MATALANDSGVPSTVEQLFADPTGYGKQLLTGWLKGVGKSTVEMGGMMGDQAIKMIPGIGPVVSAVTGGHPVSDVGRAQVGRALDVPSGTPGSAAQALGEFTGPPMAKIGKIPAIMGSFGSPLVMDAARRTLYENMLKRGASREEMWRGVQAWVPGWEKKDLTIGKTADVPHALIDTEGGRMNIPTSPESGPLRKYMYNVPELEKVKGGQFLDTPTHFYDKPNPNEGGWRDPGTGAIGVNLGGNFDKKQVLAHEGLGHGLQAAFGHAGGGNPDAMAEVLDSGVKALDKKAQDLQFASDMRALAEKQGMVQKEAVARGAGQVFNPARLIPMFKGIHGFTPSEDVVKLAQRAPNNPDRLNAHMQDVLERRDHLQNTPFDAYEAIGGEGGANLLMGNKKTGFPGYFGGSLQDASKYLPWEHLQHPESRYFDINRYRNIGDIGLVGK